TPSPWYYTLSLHDALPISLEHALQPVAELAGLDLARVGRAHRVEQVSMDEPAFEEVYLAVELHFRRSIFRPWEPGDLVGGDGERSEEHTSELQSRGHLVCR